MTPAQEAQAQTCLTECVASIAHGDHEAAIRSIFNSHLRTIAGDPLPWWASEHFRRTEAALPSLRAGRAVTGFADNLVGLTAIEYEKDLTVTRIHDVGLGQVRDYMAGLLNLGAAPGSVRGVLSDTVRWSAYEIVAVAPTAVPGAISATDVTLNCLASIDCCAADLTAARLLHQFLEQHLGRNGGQMLNASTLHTMLGVTSVAGIGFVANARAVVDAAFAADPAYAAMMQNLWANFVSFVGTDQAGVFDIQAYAHELYLLTLAKLIAANALQGSALISTPQAMLAILDGQHFAAQGLTNLVEYDYFGWLTKPAHVAPLLQLATNIQQALQAFDFSFLVPQDLFGPLICQMAERTQRVLLGQEPTPGWLVRQIVDKVESKFLANDSRRYVDPCCGSGAFVVEVLLRRASAPGFAGLSREARGQALCEAIYGFDIDPLAVVLAKVSWLISAKPSLMPFNSAYPTSIPLYHADSLFAMTPLAHSVAAAGSDFSLNLDGHRIALPAFLAEPTRQALFDEFAEGLYSMAQSYASSGSTVPTPADVANVLLGALATSGAVLDAAQTTAAASFGLEFAAALATLERDGRNGLWLHMLKNGYRPAMVRGKFDAVVTNFPWLALSKLADNPYKNTLQRLTASWSLQPAASSAPHLELATIFFLHAAKHYLGDSGFVAAVVPNSVVQGQQHAPFRARKFALPPSDLQLNFSEVWDVDAAAFTTNRAAVVLAQKNGTAAPLTGAEASPTGLVPHPLYLSTLNAKNAWTRAALGAGAGYTHYVAAQGADIMPRTIWFHEVTLGVGPGGAPVANVGPIRVGVSQKSYLLAQPKLAIGFRARARTLPAKWVFNVLTSAHVVQFNVNPPDAAILPLEPRNAATRQLTPASGAAIAVSRPAFAHFNEAFSELDRTWPALGPFGSESVFLRKLNIRNKLSTQRFATNARLVVYGASGTYPCAAVLPLGTHLADNIVVDQTVYWATVNDADEADYMVGMMNSDTLVRTIRPFQTEGMFGPRHLHTLPVQVLEPWDSTNPAHQTVLATTRALTSELAAAAATDARLHAALTVPTASVDRRRQVIREALPNLPSFIAYQAACLVVLPS